MSQSILLVSLLLTYLKDQIKKDLFTNNSRRQGNYKHLKQSSLQRLIKTNGDLI